MSCRENAPVVGVGGVHVVVGAMNLGLAQIKRTVHEVWCPIADDDAFSCRTAMYPRPSVSIDSGLTYPRLT
jgi:hypothetical protein